MKRAIFKGPGIPLSIETVPDPTPAPNEVVIKIGRCGICGSDLKMTEPGSPVLMPAGTALGHEYAGEIAALGREVSGLAVGDRVTAIPVTGCGSCPACLAEEPYHCTQCRYIMGGFSEFTLADSRYVSRLPATLSFSDGALVEPLACGAQSARFAGVGPESRVLVIGLGPMGLAAIYWSRRAGARHVLATALSNRHESLARTLGATDFVADCPDLAAVVSDRLSGPPDVVFECAGAPGLIGRAIACIRAGGTIVSGGMCFQPEAFVAGNAVLKQVRLQFSLGYTMDDFRRALTALDAGFVEPRAMITETVGLEALPDMLEWLRHDRSRCKVMIDPWADDRQAP